MLSDNCPNGKDEDGNIEFTVDLHCVRYTIFAKPINFLMDEGYAEYDITGWMSENI
jgi:hypothetical protein